MIPIEQKVIHDPDNGQYGDCQTAVVASILELDYNDVPHFSNISKFDAEIFWTLVHEFLESKGFCHTPITRDQALLSDYIEISGPSPRGNGIYHTVVGYKGEIIHDPHPSKAGLIGNKNDWYYAIYNPI